MFIHIGEITRSYLCYTQIHVIPFYMHRFQFVTRLDLLYYRIAYKLNIKGKDIKVHGFFLL